MTNITFLHETHKHSLKHYVNKPSHKNSDQRQICGEIESITIDRQIPKTSLSYTIKYTIKYICRGIKIDRENTSLLRD